MHNIADDTWTDITVANEIIRTYISRMRCARHQLGQQLTSNGQQQLRLMQALGGYWDYGSTKAAAEGEITHGSQIANIRAGMPERWQAWRSAIETRNDDMVMAS